MSLPAQVASPLTQRVDGARLMMTVATSSIRRAYKDQFGYDATECFSGVNEVGLYSCVDTGLEFFLPASVAGPESLYRTLEQFPWNYEESKWEHKVALALLKDGDRLLDVGCGRGAFLSHATQSAAVTALGIELNQSAAQFARNRQLNVCDELIEAHALTHREAYDVVTSFQVLEHLADPAGFLAGCVAALRPGGRLILGVPNNDAFLRFDDAAVLNGPPHHMSRWGRRSLEALAGLYPIRVASVETEPLLESTWYCEVMERRYLRHRVTRALWYRLGFHKAFRAYVEENAANIDGHTILAVYEKL